MNGYVALMLGIVCAGIGGELFVRAVVGLVRWVRISAAIMGTTVAAFATSSPELFVGWLVVVIREARRQCRSTGAR